MSATPRQVLVVDDDQAVLALVQASLEADGFSVTAVSDLAAARERLAASDPDVIVLDVELPDGSGLQLLRELQTTAQSPVPVVILSSKREEVDRVVGLELGAEDYVVKPFFPRELATRVRRAADRQRASKPPRRLRFDGLEIDLATHDVVVRGHPVELTTREFTLLAHLASAPRRVLGRDQLLREVWDSMPEWQSARTVTEHIRRIRHKIEEDPRQPRWILTVGRAGYRFEP